MNRPFKKSGFTLFEVIVASVLSAFIALVAAGGLRGVLSARTTIDDSLAVTDELRFAANQMRADLLDVYRPKEGFLFEGSAGDLLSGELPRLRFHAVCSQKARQGRAESYLYEIEYFIYEKDDKSWFCRRICPIVGNEDPDDEGAPQGVLIKLSESIGLFEIRYFDGQEWTNEWPIDNASLPVMLEISLVAAKNDEKDKKGKEPELLTK